MLPQLVEHKFVPIVPDVPPVPDLPVKELSMEPVSQGVEKYITCNKLCFLALLFMGYMLWSRYKNYEKPLMLNYGKTEPRPYNI